MNHVLSPARLVPCSAGKGSVIPISALGENSVTIQGLSPRKRGRKPKKSTQWPKRSPGCSERTGGFLKNSSRQKPSSRFKKNSELGHFSKQQRRTELMGTVAELGETVGMKTACQALAVPRSSFDRRRAKENSSPVEPVAHRPAPPLALSRDERQAVFDVAHEERFWDATPYQIYATLLDEGQYLASIRTFYRILAANQEVRERRRLVSRAHYKKPELLATKPNEVWSWDITKLKGPAKWTYFQLYVIIDIFSRYVVGWMVDHRESAALAKRLIAETCGKQQICREQLTLHADRGSSMKSKLVAHLLADLGVTKTHSRPHVSNDNPYPEAQFKTLKYSPGFPGRFGSIQDARAFCQKFFSWYNTVHKHSGIGLMTPEQVHFGLGRPDSATSPDCA